MSFLLIPIQTYPNTALGYESSINTTLGIYNTAFGEATLRNNKIGSSNTAIGATALYFNDSGDANTAVGNNAMFQNVNGASNSAFGTSALSQNVAGTGNCAFGYETLRQNLGSYNTAFGGGAGNLITTGTLNTLVGFVSGYNITTGSKNTVLGPFNGNQFGLDIRTLSNYIVISDGDGNPRIWVNNTGQVNFPGGGVFPTLRTQTLQIVDGGGNIWVQMLQGSSGSLTLSDIGTFGWTSGYAGGTADTVLRRDAADTLAQRRGVNAQAFRIYNTFTDASNYERGRLEWASNTFRIGTQAAGTGTLRDTEIFGSNIYFNSGGSYRWFFTNIGHLYAYSDNTFDIGQVNSFRPRNLFLGSYMQIYEMTAPAAPAANSVRIYAEDNGAGKTRIMALFATGAAQQIAIEP